MDLIKNTFITKTDQLPTNAEIMAEIEVERWDNWDFDKMNNTWKIRKEYTKYMFPILSHEFLLSIKNMVNDLDIYKISEIACGTGWFTHWLEKYDIPISDCIDNKSWKKKFNYWLPAVTIYDASHYVKKHPNIQMFILSWPYMDTLAYRIWKNMKKGQYLFYIGESYGGCTADERFFDEVENSKVESKQITALENNFLSFLGLHDRPIIYRK